MEKKKRNKKDSHSGFVIYDKFLPKSKRSQLTVFIILALLIVILLLIYFLGRDKMAVIFKSESPYNQIDKCIKDSASDAIGTLENQGWTINPQNYYLYQGNKVDYMCYTNEYYKKCVMQKPLLKQDIEKEIKDFIEPRVEGCLNSIKQSYENKGYSFTFKKPKTNVQILPGDVLISLENADLVVTKESTESYKNIKVDVSSNLYDFTMTASSIANWETTYGESETLNYMLVYPELKVEKKIRSDGTKIYILTNRESLEKFMFAIRSIPFPAGVTGE